LLNVSITQAVVAMTMENPSIYRSILFFAAAVATISSMSIAPVFAQTSESSSSAMSSQNNTSSMSNIVTAVTNNTISSSLMMLNLGAPLFIEHDKTTNTTSIDPNTLRILFEGNGTLMLPSGNVSTHDSGIARVSSGARLSGAGGQLILMTLDGKEENATIDFTEFVPANSTTGIGVAYIQTNSTGQLAPLNNVIGVFTDEMGPQIDTVTFWKWK
jgi:hypothetical protein